MYSGIDSESPARGCIEHAGQRFVHDADDDDAAHIARRFAHQRAQREAGVFVRGRLHGPLPRCRAAWPT